VAVDAGGPRTLIEDGRTGLLRPAGAAELADGLCELATWPVLRRRLAAAALAGVRERTWERSLGQLAQAYARALAPQPAEQALQASAA
jgi:glycosyltransferase involved in cell wall biosynthesis